jgi:hypothetical protein
LIYPIVTIFIIWTVSGHVGPAEAALGLKSDLPGWSRAVMAAAVAFQGFAIWRVLRTAGWKSLAWLVVTFAIASAFVALGAIAGAFPFAGVVAVIVAVAYSSCVLPCAQEPAGTLRFARPCNTRRDKPGHDEIRDLARPTVRQTAL